MPNWAHGNIRFRGKLENIKKLLEEVIVVCRYKQKDDDKYQVETETLPVKVEFDHDDDPFEVHIFPKEEKNGKEWLYISGTSRNFLSLSRPAEAFGYIFDARVDGKDTGESIVFIDDFDAAWAARAEDYLETSKKYNVDIKIFTWECGMCFSQEIEIIKGKLTKFDSPDYKDWGWDSPLPMCGG